MHGTAHYNFSIIRKMMLFFALLFGAIYGGGSVAAQTEDNPIPSNGNWTICHFTNENAQNPYIQISPALNSFLGANGHFQHDDGADIIPPFWYMDGNTSTSFPGLNWDAEGQAQFNNNCRPLQPPPPPPPPITAVLGPVTFVDATCVVAPSVSVPANGNGVTYSYNPATVVPGGTVTVSATLNSATHVWGDTTGWTGTGDPNVLTRSFTFANPDCRATAVLGPVTFINASCVVAPSVSVPANGNGVTYSYNPATVVPGGTVTVSATLNAATHVWGDTTGWTATGDPNVLTRSFTFANPECPTTTTTPTQTATTTPTETPTSTPTETPTGTATETPTSTATSTAKATTPAAQKTPAAVVGLPDTGAGDGSGASGIILLVMATGALTLAGVGTIISQRKRA